jgi:D-serine deaminase-like pyridoxal phosphate-dependent protein
MEWYTIQNAEALDTPALVIYPDRIKKNLAVLKSFVGDIRKLRPHVKTSKSPDVVRLMMEAGITKFKCATIAEAEMLAQMGAKDVLLAYQPVGPKAERFCLLQETYRETVFSCLVDNSGSLAELSAASEKRGETVRVLIDLNVGMNRTGIAPGKEAFELYQRARRTNGIMFVGLHAYDGHLRDADLALRTEKCDAAFRGVELLRQQIKKEDSGGDPLIVVGGTPTFPIHAKRADVEASPGTFIFWDRGYQQVLTEQPFEFAAVVVARIISKPDDHTLCVDLGHKSIASENPVGQRVYFMNAPELQPIGHSEEHMVFRNEAPTPLKVGDVLYGIPHHVCPTVALYEEAAVCENNSVTERWTITARKRRIKI